jgi:hypothetical protein
MPRLPKRKSSRANHLNAPPHGKPDDFDPKRWILDRAFPEQYGGTVREQLRNRLLLAEFTNIKLIKNSGRDAAWTVRMNRGTHTKVLDEDELIQCLMSLANDLGKTIGRAGITAAVSGEQIDASFIMLA